MSNEELANRIKNGETDLTMTLWRNVKRFVAAQAIQFSRRPGRYEVDDLIQAGFIAMLRAIDAYVPEKASFIHFLAFYLRAEFPNADGIGRKADPLTESISLETPLSDEWDSNTLQELIEDPNDRIGELEREIWLEQLRGTLDAALNELSEEQRNTLTARYYAGKTVSETAAATDSTTTEIRKREHDGLKKLRKEAFKNGLEHFIDQRTNFYLAVEKTVIYREDIRERGVIET